jgi:hypothetical protein
VTDSLKSGRILRSPQEAEAMHTDAIPLEQFVQATIVKPFVAEIMTGWRFEQKTLEEMLIQAMREMGIFMVPRSHMPAVTLAIIAQLRYSPEIMKMLKSAQREAQLKQQSRHSE